MNRNDQVSLRDQINAAPPIWGQSSVAVVLIHGFGDGRYIWAPFVSALEKHAGVLTMDIRVHRDSDHDPQGNYHIEKFTADAQEVIDQFCQGPLVLIGHSLEAEIAIRLAGANSGRIKGLALIDGGPGLASGSMMQMRSNFGNRQLDFASREEYRRLMREWLSIADEVMLELTAQEAIADGPDGRFHLKSDSRLSAMALPTDGAHLHLWTILEKLPYPGLLVRSEAWAVLPDPGFAEEIVRRVPRLRLETVLILGHDVMMDNSERISVVLAKFVADTCADNGIFSCNVSAVS